MEGITREDNTNDGIAFVGSSKIGARSAVHIVGTIGNLSPTRVVKCQ